MGRMVPGKVVAVETVVHSHAVVDFGDPRTV